jgi:NADH-quinone oxidoreductase subunit J
VARDLIAFYLFATMAVASSLGVIGQANPLYSVLLLIASFGALSGLYILLDAPLVAVIQIIVYAGAIMVVFLFVVMLLAGPRRPLREPAASRGSQAARVLGAALALLLVGELTWALARAGAPGSRRVLTAWSTQQIGQTLFTEYAVAFEATSVLILLAMIGAVVLARRLTPAEQEESDADPARAPEPDEREESAAGDR